MRLSDVKDKACIEVVRDGEFKSLGPITYNNPEQLGFVEDAKYLPKLLNKTNITCIITTPDLSLRIPEGLGIGVSANPRKAFYEIHNYLAKETDFYWKSFKTEIASSAKIHSTAYVAQRNVRIGDGCEIGSNVSILENSILESNVVVRAGTTIGAEGFQFSRIGEEIVPAVHAGGVLLHRGVEVFTNSCICRALFGGFTEIGEDTKINNLVHIGHGATVGKKCFIGVSAVVTGSAVIGDDVWIGPSATVCSEVVVGNQASITVGSVVTKDVAPGQRVTGNFAIDHEKFLSFMRKMR